MKKDSLSESLTCLEGKFKQMKLSLSGQHRLYMTKCHLVSLWRLSPSKVFQMQFHQCSAHSPMDWNHQSSRKQTVSTNTNRQLSSIRTFLSEHWMQKNHKIINVAGSVIYSFAIPLTIKLKSIIHINSMMVQVKYS